MTPAQISAAIGISLCGIVGVFGMLAVGIVLAKLGVILPEVVEPDEGEYE